MRQSAACGIVVFMLVVHARVRADEAKATLDGTYHAVAMTRDGKDEPADLVAGVKVKIAAGEMTFTVKGKTFPAKITVDAKAKPAAIDIAPSDGPEKGKTFPGIFKLVGGELWIAFTEKSDRPTAFKGEGDVLFVRLKRDEPQGDK